MNDSRPRAMVPSSASANVVPMVGWPAIGSSDARREDAHAHVARAFRRKDERRFGEGHLVGDALHLRGGQTVRLGEDRELVAFERRAVKTSRCR